MKKTELVGIRLSEDIKNILQQLADEDERTVSWMARKLVQEALENRGLIKKGASGKKASRKKKP